MQTDLALFGGQGLGKGSGLAVCFHLHSSNVKMDIPNIFVFSRLC